MLLALADIQQEKIARLNCLAEQKIDLTSIEQGSRI